MPRAKREAPAVNIHPVVIHPEEPSEEAPPEKPKRTRKAPAAKAPAPDSKSETAEPVTEWLDPATMTQELVDGLGDIGFAANTAPQPATIVLPTFASTQEALANQPVPPEAPPVEGGWSDEAKALAARTNDPELRHLDQELPQADLAEYIQVADGVAQELAMILEAEQADAMADSEEWTPSDEEIEAMLAEATNTPLTPEQVAVLSEAIPHHPDLDVSEIGTAEFVDYAEDGSPEWHELRSRGIGGSDTASVLGIGFKSAYTLWMEKKGHWEPLPPDPGLENIFEWGHLQEPALAEKFQRLHPEWEAYEGGSWRKMDAPWMLANPDRLLVNTETGEISILEIKTSETGTGYDNDKCPSKYVVQIRHYLWVFGLPFGYLVVKIGNSDYREFLVPADVTQPVTKIHGGTTRPSSFVVTYGDGPTMELATKNFLESKEPPAMDGNRDIYEQIRRRNMSLDRGVEVELPIEVGTALAESQDALAKAELANQEARNHVMAHMGTAQYATYNEARVASRIAKGAAAPYLKVN